MVYPEAINQMPRPVFWTILFFLMLVFLGLGSVLPLVEAVLSGTIDEVNRRGEVRQDGLLVGGGSFPKDVNTT